MTVSIDLETAIRLAEEVVAAAPEGYVYTNLLGQVASRTLDGDPTVSCDYLNPATMEGSCIVGKVILASGVSYYAAHENTSAFARPYLNNLQGLGTIKITEAAISFLADIQYKQDRGTPWVEALASAKARVQHLL